MSRTEQRAGRGADRGLRRQRTDGPSRVTNVELFFDLVYVFAVTQLSHYLLAHQTVTGGLQAGLLLVMVWLLWAYTTWVTNWLDPEQTPVRLLLLGLMLVSLVMSAGLPEAFTDGGVLVGGAYAVMQIGRSVFAVWALRGGPQRRNYERILCWCCVSGALAVVGGLAGPDAREARCGWPRWRGPGGQPVGLLHAGTGPVPHPGVGHRGRSLRRALSGASS